MVFLVPLSVVGLTAAIRNIKGTINTKKKLEEVIKGVEQSINKYKKEGNNSVVERLQAFKKTLQYSKFDTNFNLLVPGVINGAASTLVLSSAIYHSPWALPVIGLYSGCQTVKNFYDLTRIWNRVLPEEPELRLKNAGIKKVNNITKSKRIFYSANTLGFLTFTIGAVITFLSIANIVSGTSFLIAGIVTLSVGVISTGIMNNIWTEKFKPRNGDLGIEREKLDCTKSLEEIGKRRDIKKIIKEYKNKHIPYSFTDNLKRFAYKIVTSLPFLEQKGAELIHELNRDKLKNHNYLPTKTLNRERLELLESLAQVEHPDFKLENNEINIENYLKCLDKLNIEDNMINKFIENKVLNLEGKHDTSMKTIEDYKNKLTVNSIFTKSDSCKNTVKLNLEAIEKDTDLKQAFIESVEEYIVFEYEEKLRYQQYGLNDFFWQLDKETKGKVADKNKELDNKSPSHSTISWTERTILPSHNTACCGHSH